MTGEETLHGEMVAAGLLPPIQAKQALGIKSRQSLLLQRLHLAVTSQQANPAIWEAAKKRSDIECKARAEAKRARKLAVKTK